MSSALHTENGLPPEVWSRILVGYLPEYRPVLRAVCQAWDTAFACDLGWNECPMKEPAELFREGNCELVQWARDRWPCWPDTAAGDSRCYVHYHERWLYEAGRSGSIPLAFLLRGWSTGGYDLGAELAAGAAREGHLRLARMAKLWAGRENINANVLLEEAATGGHEEMVALAREWEGSTLGGLERALSAAARHGHESLVWRILDWAADVDRGRGALHRADLVLISAAAGDHPVLLQTAADLGAQNYPYAMEEAAVNGSARAAVWLYANAKLGPAQFDPDDILHLSYSAGHASVASLARDWGAGPYENMLEDACASDEYEQRDETCESLARFARSMGADDCYGMARAAARRSSLNLVVLAKEWGAVNYGEIAAIAARDGHVALVHLAKEWGASNYDEIARKGARSYSSKNGLEIVRAAKEWGATDCEGVLVAAARSDAEGSEVIMRFAKEWGATNFDAAMAAAGKSHRTSAALLAKQWGATDYEALLLAAVRRGSLGCVKLAKEWGASNLETGATLAACRGDVNLVELFLSWGHVDATMMLMAAEPLANTNSYDYSQRLKLVELVRQWSEATSASPS